MDSALALLLLTFSSTHSDNDFTTRVYVHKVGSYIKTSCSQSLQAVSRIHCVCSCSVQSDCKSLLYNTNTGQCHLHANVTTDPVPFGLAEGSYYILQQEKPTRNCSTNDSCTGLRYVCASCSCRCEVGMSFDPKRNKCTKGCWRYGSEFTTYPGHWVHEHNDARFLELSLWECQKRCVKMEKFVCKTFEFGKEVDFPFMPNVCFLSREGYFDVPIHTRSRGDKPWTLGVRHCKP